MILKKSLFHSIHVNLSIELKNEASSYLVPANRTEPTKKPVRIIEKKVTML